MVCLEMAVKLRFDKRVTDCIQSKLPRKERITVSSVGNPPRQQDAQERRRVDTWTAPVPLHVTDNDKDKNFPRIY
jgi:hypothetical protein